MRRLVSRFARWRRATSFDRLRQSAKRGDGDAQFRLGLSYLLGDGVAAAPRLAVNWLELAAAQGHARAQHNLSLIYLSGAAANGPVAQWLNQAEASALGRANAALLFPNGLSVAVAHDRAFAYAQAAAEGGYAPAQANLGMLYLRGVGCVQDFAAAEHWCRSAAEQDDPGGALGLGIIREHGFVGPADPAEAASWYQIAVEAGNDAAATALGKLHLEGRGVAQNLVKAERLLAGPAARGNAFARQALNSLQTLRQKANA